MSSAYLDRQDSPLYGGSLIIYRRKDQQNGNFMFRAKIDGTEGYVRRTTKTNDPQEAMRIASDEFDELRIRHKGGFSLQKVTVEKFFNDWLSKNRNRYTEQRFKWKQNVFDRYMLGYFGKKEVCELTKKFVDDYWPYRLRFWDSAEGQQRIEVNEKRIGAKTISSHNVAKKPAHATLKAEASLINEFLRAAVDVSVVI
jgi:integrase